MRTEFHMRRWWGQDRVFLMIDFSQKWRRIVCILAPSDVRLRFTIPAVSSLQVWVQYSNSLIVLAEVSESLKWLDWFLSDVHRIGKQILNVQGFDKIFLFMNGCAFEFTIWMFGKSKSNQKTLEWHYNFHDHQHCVHCILDHRSTVCWETPWRKVYVEWVWRWGWHLVNHGLTVCVMME